MKGPSFAVFLLLPNSISLAALHYFSEWEGEAPLGAGGRALPARFSRWTNIGTQSGRGHRFLRDLAASLDT